MFPIGGPIKWSRCRWRHMTLKGQLTTPICLERNISKTAEDIDCVPKNYHIFYA